MSNRLSQKELHERLIEDLSPYIEAVNDTGKKPLMISLGKPFFCSIKAYVFNCTCPPGGRTIDEYKVQLILDGQKRGERGHFEENADYYTIIFGYADPLDDPDDGVWILFETEKHRDFAYSSNIQIYLRQLLQTLSEDVFVYVKHNKETCVLSRRPYLSQALQKRLDIDLNILLEE